MAAYEPGGGVCPGASGVATRTSGAGRSSSDRIGPSALPGQAIELFEVHEIVDAHEEEPLAAAQATDQRVRQRAALGLVAGDSGRGLAHRRTALVEEPEQLVA